MSEHHNNNLIQEGNFQNQKTKTIDKIHKGIDIIAVSQNWKIRWIQKVGGKIPKSGGKNSMKMQLRTKINLQKNSTKDKFQILTKYSK